LLAGVAWGVEQRRASPYGLVWVRGLLASSFDARPFLIVKLTESSSSMHFRGTKRTVGSSSAMKSTDPTGSSRSRITALSSWTMSPPGGRLHPPAPRPAQEPGPPLNDAHMNESISELQRLLQEIVGHLKSGAKTDTRKVVAKLERMAALASTLALTVQARR
jgi:hypothetical protein